jgi:hypothetical protein
MTTFLEMQNKVDTLTKRPELTTLRDMAIRMATLRAHQVDFFPRDQANVPLVYTPMSGNEIYIDIPNIFDSVTQLRTPDFLQALDSTTLIPAETLEHVVDYKNFWDEWNCIRPSVFTLLGSTLRFRSLANTGRAQLYYYKNPVVTDVGYSSWIADLHPDELAVWAASIVWMRAGFQEIAQQSLAAIQMFKEMLVTSYLSSKV